MYICKVNHYYVYLKKSERDVCRTGEKRQNKSRFIKFQTYHINPRLCYTMCLRECALLFAWNVIAYKFTNEILEA